MVTRRRFADAAAAEPADSANDREPRRAVSLSGFGLLEDGTTFGFSVVELSYKGCRIETELALLPGLTMSFSVLGSNQPLQATVRWYREGVAGLEFVEDESLSEQAARKHDRVEVSAEVVLRRMGRHHYQARLFDLTPSGCRVEFVERPRAGELLWVKFPRFDAIEATVKWVDGFNGGLEFVRPIYPAIFDLLLADMGAPAARLS